MVYQNLQIVFYTLTKLLWHNKVKAYCTDHMHAMLNKGRQHIVLILHLFS